MERTVPMPKLGMTMTEGVLLRWHVAAGDTVAKDDVLAEVETDKVELEVESPVAGRVTRLLAKEGQTIPVGEPVLALETDVSKSSNGRMAAPDIPAQPMPAGAAGQRAVTHPSEPIIASAAGAPNYARYATLPIQPRIPCTPAARRIALERGVDMAEVAQALRVRGIDRPVRAADVLAHMSSESDESRTSASRALTPLARKIATAHGLTPEALASAASEAGHRLDRRAVQELLAAHEQATPQGPVHANGHSHMVIPVPEMSPSSAASLSAPSMADEELLSLSSMRRTIAERTTHSFTTTPHIYLDTEVDMAEAEALRATYAMRSKRTAQPVPSATALLVRVCAIALRQHSEVNAAFVPARDGQPAGVRRWRVVNIGVAVALTDGLLVPVVRDADRKSLPEITTELADLAERARSGKLRPDELADGTFSVSNLGMYGIDTFHAVLNEPQAAILAVGRIAKRPIVLSDESGHDVIAVRPMLKLSLSADHRVLDGATGARFLATLRELLEEPRLLI